MEGDEVPSHVFPLFFTTQTQSIFKCVVDDDVTDDNPYKLIKRSDILQDFKNRAAISDFHAAKKIVQDWLSEELLVVYDPVFQYGQNFYLVTTEEEKELLLNPIETEAEEESGNEGDENADGGGIAEVSRPTLRTPKQWVSLGSDREIYEGMIYKREKITVTIARKRFKFGAPVEFTDRDESDPKAAITIDCPSYEDDSFIVSRNELDKSVQHVPELTNITSQTDRPCPRNVNVQHSPRDHPQNVNPEMMQSQEMTDFFQIVIPRFELPLQQNAASDVSQNDYEILGEMDEDFVSKPDHHLREYQSFADLQCSKNKTVSYMQWHPTIQGLIAVSCMEKLTFYERVDSLSKSLMTKSLIFIWSFANPIHPLLLLEAPDDITCFQFNPLDPDIICAGCINGQVVVWNISMHSELIKSHSFHSQGPNVHQNTLSSIFTEKKTELTPIVRYCALSSIEHSHRFSITDILWVPDHIEIGGMGQVYESKSKQCTQIMSCSPDGSVLIWSQTKVQKQLMRGNSSDETSRESSASSHMELTWKLIHKVTVQRTKSSGEYRPLKFSISEIQTQLKVSEIEKLKLERENERETFSATTFKKRVEAKPLENINTKFYVGTEEGELVYVDWNSNKDIATGNSVSPPPEFVWEAHDSSICSLQKSPFIKDIFLTVGGCTFFIWKHGVNYGPIFKSGIHECKLTSGCWSSSRPGVFFIGKSDGDIDVWDFFDKTHEPFLTQNVTAVAINSVTPYSVSKRQELLAAGDDVGTVHTFEVPWTLRRSPHNELNIIENYFEMEANRLQFLQNRNSSKATETMPGIRNDVLPGTVIGTEEEWEIKAKAQYQDYLTLEKYWLDELGILPEVI